MSEEFKNWMATQVNCCTSCESAFKEARKGYLKLDDVMKIVEDQKFMNDEYEVEYVANVQLERVKKKIKELEGEG